jgi:predicted nucleic acid-binding Zn ribbon protein
MSGNARGPLRVSEALQKYLTDSGIGERIEEASVLPEWAERVGVAIAAVTMPLRVSHGTLVVGVRSSAWLMELKLMEREILRRLNEGRAKGRIDGIRFVMGDADPG